METASDTAGTAAAAAPPRPAEAPGVRPVVWALAGGKGGVGRSLLAANLGIHLARAGRRVVLVDLDLQGSNLHTLLGYQRLPRTLADLAAGRAALLSELTCETPTTHLRILGGVLGTELRDDPVHFVRQVAEQFPTLSAEHVILDCGSGRSPATVAAFAESAVGVLVTTPEPAALEALCLFAESHLRWCVTRALTGEAMAAVEARLREGGLDPARLPFRAFMARLALVDAAARDAIAAVVRRTRLELLLNQVRAEAEEEAGPSLQSGFRKCFGLQLGLAGVIEHDLSVLQAIQKRRPLSQQYPNAAATKGVGRAASRLLATAVGPTREPDEEWEDLESIDHYRVLEVVPRASAREVQSAYQLLKRTYDPETTVLAPVLEAPGLRDLQARIEAAYRTLIFLESRSTYDRQMQERGAPRPGTPPGPAAGAPAAPEGLEIAGGAGVTTPEAAPATPPPAAFPADPPSPDPGTAPEAAIADPGAGAEPPPGSGAELRDQRGRRRLSLAAIAERTKIRPAHLVAIEEERFGDLPAAVFVRGFLREYARCLGLPPDEVTRRYMQRYRDWHESRNRPPAAGSGAGA